MKNILTCIATLLMATGTLQANTITYTNSVLLPNDTLATLSLQKFDSSLGTLNGVYLELWTIFSGVSVGLDNDSINPGDATASFICSIKSFSVSVPTTGFDYISVIDSTVLNPTTSEVFHLGATSGDAVGVFNETGESDYALWIPGTLSGIDGGYIITGAIGSYEGTGSFTASLKALYGTSATMNVAESKFEGSTPSGLLAGRVIYDYTAAIPEPATASMMLLAGLIALLARRHFMD